MKKYFKKHSKPVSILISCGIALLILAVCLCIDYAVSAVIGHISADRTIDIVSNMLEGFIAAAAAGLVYFELEISQEKEDRENDIHEASFILQYNQALIQDENMRKVEHWLEEKMFYGKEDALVTEENRQMFVDFLVYIEGMAPPILNGIMKLEHIDDLMAYRVFLSLCCRELQEDQLMKFPQYFRGCFKLYRKWTDYYDELHERGIERRSVLEGILYEEDGVTRNPNARELWKIPQYEEYSKFEEGIDKVPEVRTPNHRKEVITEEELSFRQLNNSDQLSEQQLKQIAGLIYDTDPYIYPALFGSGAAGRANALKIIPELIKSGNDAMFSLDNIFAVLLDDWICGIILWHKGKIDWDAENFINVSKRITRDVDLKNINTAAESYFAENYESDANEGILSIVNVCVSSSLRGMGIGNLMMGKFTELHDNEPMELCVIRSNTGAIELYRRNRFEVCEERTGFALDNRKPEVYIMKRK